MTIELPDLPYANDALAPHLSAETLDLHHGKHHKAYVDKVNELVEDKPQVDWPLERIVMESEGALLDNAAQVWNHAFYWNSMRPKGGGKPKGHVAKSIDRDFGSFANFRKEFVETATKHFGSGWAWIVTNGDKLSVLATHDADLPMRHRLRALLACDLWEHAYYVDYRNERPKYVNVFLDHLANWEWVEKNLG